MDQPARYRVRAALRGPAHGFRLPDCATTTPNATTAPPTPRAHQGNPGICGRDNAAIQEQSLGIQYNTNNDLLDYLVDPSVFAYSDGAVDIPLGPGLGIEIDEEYVAERAKEGHRWRNPIWRHADGSVAEW